MKAGKNSYQIISSQIVAAEQSLGARITLETGLPGSSHVTSHTKRAFHSTPAKVLSWDDATWIFIYGAELLLK